MLDCFGSRSPDPNTLHSMQDGGLLRQGSSFCSVLGQMHRRPSVGNLGSTEGSVFRV